MTGRYTLVTDVLDKAEFAVWKDEHIRQIKQKLSELRRREDARQGIGIDGMTLEGKLATLQKVIRRKAPYPSNASWLTQTFNHEQLTALYCLLDDIEEHISVRRLVDVQKAFERISTHRKKLTASEAN